MCESSRKGKQSAQQLWDLLVIYERSEGQCNDCCDADSQFDAVEDPDVEDRSWSEAIRSQQVDEVRRCEVNIDVLQAEQRSEQYTAQ